MVGVSCRRRRAAVQATPRHVIGCRQRAAQILIRPHRQERAVGAAVRRRRRGRVAAVLGAARLRCGRAARSATAAVGLAAKRRPAARQAGEMDEVEIGAVAEPVEVGGGLLRRAAAPAARSARRGRRRCSRDRSRRRDPESRRPGSLARAGKPTTRSRDSPSCLGASLATCSISSLKLTAPALDLDAEDLADDAAQQPLEARVLERRQRANRLFLVRFEQRAARDPRRRARRAASERRRSPAARAAAAATAPSPGRGPSALRLVARQRQQQRRSADAETVDRLGVRQVVEIVADLVGDAERLAVVAQHLLRVGGRAGERGADAERDLKGRRRLAAEDVQHLERRRAAAAAASRRAPRPGRGRARDGRRRRCAPARAHTVREAPQSASRR